MERLQEGMGQNSAAEYNRIFQERQIKGVDPLDLRRWRKLLSRFRGGRLIDLGCLDSLVPQLAKNDYPDADVYGLDLAGEAIMAMQAKYPEVNYLMGDLYDTQIPDSFFDYVVLGEVLEHLDEPIRAIREAMRILKPGGTLALSTPKEETTKGEVDGHRHLWSYNKEDLYWLLRDFGRVTVKTLRSQYFPKYRYQFPVLIAFCTKQ